MYNIIDNVELIHITKDVVNKKSNIFKDFYSRCSQILPFLSHKAKFLENSDGFYNSISWDGTSKKRM